MNQRKFPKGHWKEEEKAVRAKALSTNTCAICGSKLSETTNVGTPFCHLRHWFPGYFEKQRGLGSDYIYVDTFKKVVWSWIEYANLSDHQVKRESVMDRPGVDTTWCSSVYTDRYFASWSVTKGIVRARDENRCRSCGLDFATRPEESKSTRPEFDHIVPVSRGGSLIDPNNIQLLCGACHTKKTAEERRPHIYELPTTPETVA